MSKFLVQVDFRESVWPPGTTSGSAVTKVFRATDSLGNETGFTIEEVGRFVVIRKGGKKARYPMELVARLVEAGDE